MSAYLILSVLLLPSVYCTEQEPDLIVHGKPAYPGQFPWHALIHLVHNNQPTHFGGSVIAPDFILTTGKYISRVEHSQRAIIYLGSIYYAQPLVTMESETFFVHPRYHSKRHSFDYGLIKLRQRLVYSSDIRPIRLPNRSHQEYEYVDGLVSGFGMMSSQNPNLSERLLYTHQRTMSNAQCKLTYPWETIDNTVLCAAAQSNTHRLSACYGDDGGALVTYENNEWTQIGLVSFFPTQGCDYGLPVGYMKVTSALDWISSVAGLPSWPPWP